MTKRAPRKLKQKIFSLLSSFSIKTLSFLKFKFDGSPPEEKKDGEEDGKDRGSNVAIKLSLDHLVRHPVGVPGHGQSSYLMAGHH